MSRTDRASPKQRPKRRWLQFRLRTMLLAVTAVGMWLGLHFYPAQRQRRAVEAIEALGGSVGYDYQVTGDVKVIRQKAGGVWVRRLQCGSSANSRVPPWLRNLLGEDLFSTVTWVRLTGPEIGDKELAHICELRRLRYLDLSWTSVTDDGLKHLSRLNELDELHLRGTPVSDNGLAHLNNLSNRRRLNLQTTRATTAGMKHLAELRHLRALELGTAGKSTFSQIELGYAHGKTSPYHAALAYLNAIQVQELQRIEFSDPSNFNRPLPEHGGLLHLKALKDLAFLDVTYTRVTAAEVQELQRALPNLVIRHPGELIAQTQALRKRLSDRHDEGMLFEAWQRRRQWRGNVPGAR